MHCKGGDLPEWGSAAPSYGRDCMTKAPRQFGVGKNGSSSCSENCSKAGQGSSTKAGKKEGTSNETSSDNPFSRCCNGGAVRHSHDPERGVLTLPALPRGGEGATTVHSKSDNGGITGSCNDIAVSSWTVAMVEQWLAGMNLGFLSERFLEEAIDGEALLELQDEDLVFLGVTKLGIRRKLMKHIKMLRAGPIQRVSPECTPVVNPSALSNSSRSSSRHGLNSNVRMPDSVYDQVGHNYNDMSKGDGGHELFGTHRTTDGRVSPAKGLRSHNIAAPSDGVGNRDCGSPGLVEGGSGSAKVSGKGKVGGDGAEKNGNYTSPNHPLAFGSCWGTSTHTDGPSNGPEMRSRKRALWKDLPPPPSV